MPIVLSTIAALRAFVSGRRVRGERVALVPTMGALHAGHVSLVEVARRHASATVVSIFVNPTQFAPTEDFSKYPRTFEGDIRKLSEVGVEAVYAPDVETMYPAGSATTVSLKGPATAGLEDVTRPFHFDGVATIVAKLFTQSQADVALFGEKDFQQLAVIRRMAADLDLPVEIVGAPTVREADGLAMSSRNVYLSQAERARAPALHRIMQETAAAIRAGAGVEDALSPSRQAITEAGFALDYLEVRGANDLGPPQPGSPRRMLVAATLAATRLIDNIPVE
ncbi:pantoate--beta-alanine ligase [Phreatobacter sp.]|uniref:pantoate--beta-alanine ligase n=1 Tax=Phreatobacter sp. TaxID=1966341 RepID=UPI003F70778B